ncbi:LAME_0H11210g1_1 [Lachancea meyersii CBS 8951]|uniref:LAME_0H11210g1_1 n=1 Tax=Lachancea meyersii CBS 8951 TaxID=1266667 RepID=A0A1G4KG93_9SACH|nr:LAME_0H11210g1_1 [Lachancea meyersii CBS 8951]
MDSLASISPQDSGKETKSDLAKRNDAVEGPKDEIAQLLNKALPIDNNEEMRREPEIVTLYELLDVAPHGRKLKNDLFSTFHGNTSVFQHYGKSSINRHLVDTVDSWIVEKEELAGETGGLRAASRGEYSSAIFSWSSANKDKKKLSSSQGKGHTSSSGDHGPRLSLNQALQKQANAGISEFLTQRRVQERSREIEKLASTKTVSITPSSFKVDPLLKFEAHALPKQKKQDAAKRQRQQQKKKNRLSNLFFWKGSSTSEKSHHEPKSPTPLKPAPEPIEIHANPVENYSPTHQHDQLSFEASMCESFGDNNSAFGEFESACASPPVIEATEAKSPIEAGPRGSNTFVMDSFTPLRPKKKC